VKIVGDEQPHEREIVKRNGRFGTGWTAGGDPIDTADVSPTRALRMLVEQAGMTVTELGELLGSKGAASELLSGKRKEPSRAQIARLCARFKVDASVFLLPGRAQGRTRLRTLPGPRGT
jgi:hypothetical protein